MINYETCSYFNKAIKFTADLKDINVEFFLPKVRLWEVKRKKNLEKSLIKVK